MSRRDRLPDPFDGYFTGGAGGAGGVGSPGSTGGADAAGPLAGGAGHGNGSAPTGPIDPLLDLRAAERWLAVVGWGVENDLYTFQQSLEGRSGARVRVGGRSYLMASSYDYLGLIGHPALDRAAIEAIRRYGTGTGGVRLLTGTIELHRELESELADWKRTEAAMVFNSGYAANLAVLAALLGPNDLVVADERVHRSIQDGCRLAGVPVRTFRHNDVDDLARRLSGPRPRRSLVIIEGVYSMDGDIAPLSDILALRERHDFLLMVDEAHSLGVLGASGRGLDEHWGVRGGVDIWTGSLSKAIPAGGGFVAGGRRLVIYLQHGSGPFMFSAALSPPAAGAALAGLRLLAAEPWRLDRLRDNGARLRRGLVDRGFDIGTSATPLVPVVLGDDEQAYAAARELWRRGVMASAVVFPAVPRRKARLRLCTTAGHSPADIRELLDAFDGLDTGRPGDASGAADAAPLHARR